MAKQGGEFQFRVSDAVQVPLRGLMLRLRLLDGSPSVKDLAVGRRLRVSSPLGAARELVITAHAATGGRQTQKRLDGLREFDVIVAEVPERTSGEPVEIGWTASGPVEARE
jgi:hypothetical protein